MEKYSNTGGDWDQKAAVIMNELSHGRELAKQLLIHLNVPSSSSQEVRELLVQKILRSFHKALSILKWNTTTDDDENSFSGSPRSEEDSDRDFKDQPETRSDVSKKRKSLGKWSQQVQVFPATGLDDGYSWRKYGQKDILGAKFPRGYYRCTYKNLQGCLATKQVQRSDDNPTLFEITYRGTHTCTQQPTQLTPPPPEKQEPNTPQHHHNPHPIQQDTNEILLSFKTGLKVVTEDLEMEMETETETETTQNQPLSSFHFPSTPIVGAASYGYSAPTVDSNFFSSSFVSPATSGLGGNYLQNLNTSEPELNEIVSAATSATNSPTVGLDFPFGSMGFDPTTFTFDNSGFFS